MRVKRFIAEDVYTEAKRRLHHVYDLFDTVAVMFSGGKDSLAVLHLDGEVRAERGLGPSLAVFRDEEFIPQVVVDFVCSYRERVNLQYLAIPLVSSMFVLGKVQEYVQWDQGRPHLRQPPKFAIKDFVGAPLTQFSADEYIALRLGLKGKVAFLTGIRAAESLVRWRSCVNKLNENYINASSSKRVSLVKPIFDWQENDLFKYFHEQGIAYCGVYDRQMWAEDRLRVATPMLAESAKQFHKLRAVDPVLYEQVITLFPDMLLQERYWHDLDTSAAVEKYGKTHAGVRAWVLENITDANTRAKALNCFRSVMRREHNAPGSYPPDYLIKQFMSGAFKREIQPLGREEKIKRAKNRE